MPRCVSPPRRVPLLRISSQLRERAYDIPEIVNVGIYSDKRLRPWSKKYQKVLCHVASHWIANPFLPTVYSSYSYGLTDHTTGARGVGTWSGSISVGLQCLPPPAHLACASLLRALFSLLDEHARGTIANFSAPSPTVSSRPARLPLHACPRLAKRAAFRAVDLGSNQVSTPSAYASPHTQKQCIIHRLSSAFSLVASTSVPPQR